MAGRQPYGETRDVIAPYGADRLRPPASLGPAERAAFVDLIGSVPRGISWPPTCRCFADGARRPCWPSRRDDADDRGRGDRVPARRQDGQPVVQRLPYGGEATAGFESCA